MCVRGQEVDPSLLQQPVRNLLCELAFVPGQRGRRHLDQKAAAQPFDQPLGIVLQRGVALRMGQDRRHPGQLQLVEGLGQPRRKPVLRHLHQQVAQPVDAEPRRIGLRQLHVVERHVEVASQAQRQRDLLLGQPRAQLVGFGRVHARIEVVVAVCVRRAHHMRDALGHSQPRHLDRGLHAVGAIVQSGQ